MIEPWHSYLKKLRLQRSCSMDELSNLSAIPLPQISKLESRTKPPTFVQAFRLAKLFDRYPKDLFDPQTGLARTVREMEAGA